MRSDFVCKTLLIACVICVTISFAGCEGSTEPKEPEMGAIEAYLQEHPEELEEDLTEAQSEEDEFGASR